MENELKIINYWRKASKQDFETVEILFKNKKYHHALFFCHLSIEKNLKAIIVKTTRKAPPLFFKKANKKFGLKYINKTKKILTWLNE